MADIVSRCFRSFSRKRWFSVSKVNAKGDDSVKETSKAGHGGWGQRGSKGQVTAIYIVLIYMGSPSESLRRGGWQLSWPEWQKKTVT